MIKKVKQWLGIEGVKLTLRIPEKQLLSSKIISGTVHFQSLHEQTVTGIRLVLIERYARGRGEEQLIDEYELGAMEMTETFIVKPGEETIKAFQISFDLMESDIDRWGNKNILNQQLAKAARWVKKARSQYRVEAEARVQGVALNPFDKKDVNF